MLFFIASWILFLGTENVNDHTIYVYLAMSSQEVGALIAQQRSDHRINYDIVCFSKDSGRTAPGMSFSVRTACASLPVITLLGCLV